MQSKFLDCEGGNMGFSASSAIDFLCNLSGNTSPSKASVSAFTRASSSLYFPSFCELRVAAA